jgi:hypothetical protein
VPCKRTSLANFLQPLQRMHNLILALSDFRAFCIRVFGKKSLNQFVREIFAFLEETCWITRPLSSTVLRKSFILWALTFRFFLDIRLEFFFRLLNLTCTNTLALWISCVRLSVGSENLNMLSLVTLSEKKLILLLKHLNFNSNARMRPEKQRPRVKAGVAR